MADDDPMLHRIFERLGGIDAKLDEGGRRHAEFAINFHGVHAELATLNERVGKVEALAARVPVIEPAVWQLEGKRLESAGVKKFFGGVMTQGRAAVGIVGGSVGAALTAFMVWFIGLFGGHPPTPPHP